MTPTIDPEFRDLIPPPSLDELAGLEASIVEYGCRDPLVVWKEEGVLLDGHNRHAICVKRGIAFDTRSVSLKDRTAAKVWVIKNQVSRRNLNESQRAMLAAKLATLGRGDNQHASIEATSQTNAAAALNVGRASVQRAKKVITKGTPELQTAVTAGEIAVSDAAEIATVPPEKQRAIVKRKIAEKQRPSKRHTRRRRRKHAAEPTKNRTENQSAQPSPIEPTRLSVDRIAEAFRHLPEPDRRPLIAKLVEALSISEFTAFYESLGERYRSDQESLNAPGHLDPNVGQLQ